MMKKYKITTIKNGKTTTSKHYFTSDNKALEYVQKKNLNIILIQVYNNGKYEDLNINTKDGTPPKSLFKPLKSMQNLGFYFHQIALLLDSFIPLDEAIGHIQKIAKPAISAKFQDVLNSLSLGFGVAESFKNFGLSILHNSLLYIGEQSGRLQESFEIIAKDLSEAEFTKKRILKTLFYPAVVFLSIVIAFSIAVLIIIPEFASFFIQNTGTLPFITRSLLGLESFFRHFGLIILFIFLISIFIHFWFYKRLFSYKVFMDKCLLRLPIIGKIILYNRLSYFLHSLYFLQTSGGDLKNSLQIAKNTLDNAHLSLQILKSEECLSSGSSFSKSLEIASIFDELTIGLLSGGEKSGNLDKMLLATSKRYKELCNESLDKLLLYLEPICSLILAALVLYLALGIFLPIWSLQSLELG